MKKKNLLTLGALALSLGLVVTSCAGANGQDGKDGVNGKDGADGKDGKDGKDGVDGKDGKDGQNGKTYIPIIVNSWLMPNVKVTQDKFFVEPGESVTFTFELSSSSTKGEVLTSLKFNDVEQLSSYVEADNNGKATWILTTASTDKGFQMTAADFGTINGYAEGLIDDHIKAISDNDHLVGRATVGDLNNTNYVAGVNTAYASVTGYDVTVYGQLATAKAKISSKISALGANPTTSAKVKAALEGAEEGKKLISDKYEEVLKAEKEEQAGLVDSFQKPNSDIAASDFAADQASAKAKIAAAKTLEEVAEVMNVTEQSLGNSKKFAVGSFRTLEANKNTILTNLKSTATNVLPDADKLWADGDSSHATALANMKNTLASYGISVTKLPIEVYNEYKAKVSSATSFEKDSDGKFVIEEEGKKAIKASYTELKTQLAAAIRKTYEEEVNNSEALKEMAATRSALIAVIETTVSNFVTADTNLSTTAISSYTDASITGDANSGYTSNGLVGKIEIALMKAIADNQVDAFAKERKDKALEDVKSQLLAKAKEYRTSDALYGKVFGEATYFSETNGVTNVVPTGFASVDTIITNGKTDSSKKALVVVNSTSNTGETVFADLNKVAANGSVPAHYTLGSAAQGYSTEYVAYSQYNTIKTSKTTVAEIKSSLSSALTAVDSAYTSAVSALKTSAKKTFAGTTTVSNGQYTGLTDGAVTTAWEGLNTAKKLESFDAISKAALSCDTAASLVTKVDTEVGTFLEGLKDKDNDYINDGSETQTETNSFFLESPYSSFNDNMNELVKELVAGTKGESDVTAFVAQDNLKKEYNADVATWLGKVKENLKDRYVAAQSRVTTLEGDQLTARYNEFMGLIGNKVNTSNTSDLYKTGLSKATDGAVDLTGASITSCNTIETYFGSAVLKQDKN